jgi:hypothetical protein
MKLLQTPMKKLLLYFSRKRFVRAAIADKADLSAFNGPPSPKVIVGVGAIVVSYVIGWPMVTFLGGVAVYLEEPLIAAIGGPLVYGLSHLVFLLGMYLAGAEYTWIFFRWATRVAMLKLLRKYSLPLP